MAYRNPYNRSYDNDREPEPEQTFRTRLRYRIAVWKEDLSDFGKRIRKRTSASGARAKEREEAREKRRQEKAAAVAEQARRKAEEAGEAERGRHTEDSFASASPKPGNPFLSGDTLPGENDTAETVFSTRDPLTGKKRRRIELTARFPLYIVIWITALIFTQALRSKASNIFIGFVTFLPIALLLYALTARLSLQMFLPSDPATVEKNQPYTYQMRLLNQFILPYPFVEALMILPQSNSVRCTERSVFLSMNPLGNYNIQNEVRFRFRGTYHIGVNCFYVYDFFRILRVRVDIRNYTTVSVLPRKLFLDTGKAEANNDAPDRVHRSPFAFDKLEVSDIRDYRPGDPLKSVHWNLSSKSEELIVKDYNTGASKTTYVYCDLSARFPEEMPELPEATKREQKRMKKEEKEREALREKEKKLYEKASQKRKKYGKELPEAEEIHLLTRAERKEQKKEEALKRRRAAALAKLGELAKKDPKKAAKLREALYEEDRRRAHAKEAEKAGIDGQETAKREIDIQELAQESYYEDMNEYCADGVIELTVATVLRELRAGNEVYLLWYDSRSLSGAFAYLLRGVSDLQMIYKLFATAPLSDASHSPINLTGIAGDTSGSKQIFVTSAVDKASVAAFCNMPSVSGGESFGSSEILLYNPEERFAHVAERRSYIEGCRAELSCKGFQLVIGQPGERNGGVA